MNFLDKLSAALGSLLGSSTYEMKKGQPISETRVPGAIGRLGQTISGYFNEAPKNLTQDYTSPPATPSPPPTIAPRTTQSQYVAPSQAPRATARNPAVSKYTIPSSVEEAINQAAAKFGIPPSLLYDIALQESSFDPTLRNPQEGSTASGLFQFTQPTWDTVQNYASMPDSSLKGVLPTGDRMNPLDSALAAAYLIKMGQLGRWNASQGVWGPHYDQSELAPYYAQTVPSEIPTSNWR